MGQNLRAGGTATAPQTGSTGVAQGSFAFRLAVGDVADHIDPINLTIAETVEESMGGVVALAAEVEQPVSVVSRRLRRADDGKGQRLECTTVYMAAIWRYPDARRVLLDKLLALAGCKPSEPVVTMTAEEKLALVLGELPEKRLRQIEREKGLPSGSLS